MVVMVVMVVMMLPSVCRDYMMPGDEREERARIIGDVR